jgi:hypothetical protein
LDPPTRYRPKSLSQLGGQVDNKKPTGYNHNLDLTAQTDRPNFAGGWKTNQARFSTIPGANGMKLTRILIDSMASALIEISRMSESRVGLGSSLDTTWFDTLGPVRHTIAGNPHEDLLT